MKQLPESVKIGLITYKIKRDTDLPLEGRMGSVHLLKSEISIAPDLSPDIELMTLWHEMIHAILFQGGHKGEHDEQMIDLIAHGVLLALNDNVSLTMAE